MASGWSMHVSARRRGEAPPCPTLATRPQLQAIEKPIRRHCSPFATSKDVAKGEVMHVQPLPSAIAYQGEAATKRLAELGLNEAILQHIVLAGEAARENATAHDPQTAAGSNAYQYRVRATRDSLVTPALRWTVDRRGGLEYTISPCKKFGILTRAGDEAVGLEHRHPQFACPAGEALREAISPADPRQQAFSSELVPEQPTKTTSDATNFATWILLVFRHGDLVHSELSRVEAIDSSGRAEGWLERILLPPLSIDASPTPTELDTSPATANVVLGRKKHGGSR